MPTPVALSLGLVVLLSASRGYADPLAPSGQGQPAPVVRPTAMQAQAGTVFWDPPPVCQEPQPAYLLYNPSTGHVRIDAVPTPLQRLDSFFLMVDPPIFQPENFQPPFGPGPEGPSYVASPELIAASNPHHDVYLFSGDLGAILPPGLAPSELAQMFAAKYWMAQSREPALRDVQGELVLMVVPEPQWPLTSGASSAALSCLAAIARRAGKRRA